MTGSGATVPVQSIKACVVYDSTTGQIHHQHHVLTLVGGREPAEDEIARDALQVVKSRHDPPKGSLQVLHVRHDAMEKEKKYRVDVNKKELALD